MRLPARPSLINSTPPWTLGQGWTHASGRRCTPGLIHRMTQGSTLASMSHPAPSGVDITLVVASQKCADGPDQRVPFLSLTELTRPLPEDHGEPGQQSHGWVWRCRDRPPHRRCTRSPSPWACQESAPGMSNGFLQLRSFRPFIHRRAVRAVRHLAESPPCPVSAEQNPRAAAGRHPPPATIASTTAATLRAMAPPCPPHPPALPGPPR
jgi:hypothetical protein